MVLLFFLIVAGKSVEEVHRPVPPDFVPPMRPYKHDQVASWANQVNLALRGDHYWYTRLIEFLAGLALELDAQDERISVVEIRQRLESGELELPLEVENYLKARANTGYIPRPGFWQRMEERVARLWNSLPGKKNRVSGGRFTQEELEKVIQYLEDRLEV
jgi:hypothetical protein